FEKIDSFTFFLGVNSAIYPFTIFESNFHNSLVQGHSNFGFAFLILLAYTIFIVFKKITTIDRTLVLLLLLLLARGFSDVVMFMGAFDFVFYYFIMLLSSSRLYKISNN